MFDLKLKKMSVEKKSAFSVSAVTVLVFLVLSSAFVGFTFAVAQVKAQTASTSVPSNLLQYDWPQPSRDLSLSGFNPGPAPGSASVTWKASIPGVSGVAVAFNGYVFVQASGKTYALDGGTGKTVWIASVSGGMQKIDDTYMMAGRNCLRIADGSIVWTTTLPLSSPRYWSSGGGYVPELKMFLDSQYGISLLDPSQPPVLVYNLTSQANIQTGYPMYGGGKLFIGSNDGFLRAYDAKTGTLLWKTPSSSMFMCAMTYNDGRVYFGGLDNVMRCWNATNGELLWSYNPHTWYGQWGENPSVAYGIVYEHNQDNYLYAINATTGELLWRAKGPGIAYTDYLMVGGGKVYCQMGENQYRDFNTGEFAYSEYDCYDAYTGQLLWSLPLENGSPANYQCLAYGNLYLIPTKASPSIPGEYIYTGAAASLGEVWCIGSQPADWAMFMNDPAHTAQGAGPTDLALKWTFPTNGQICSSAAISNGVAYVGSTDSNIYAIDANKGTQIWSFNTTFPVASSPAVVNGKVYSGADSGSIYCIDAATGAQLWNTFAGGITNNVLWNSFTAFQLRSSPTVVNGKLYVGSLDGNLYCLDANSGAVLWKYLTKGPIYVAPAVVNNAVYFPSTTGGYPIGWGPAVTNGTFYKLDANSGAVIWQKDIPYVLNRTSGTGNFLISAPTVANGMVFVRNGYYETYALNATTGETVWKYYGMNSTGLSSQSGGVVQINAPLYAYGNLFMNDYYGIVCLNANSGAEVWYAWLSRENISPALAYSYNRIYTVNELGTLYVLDAITGSKLSYCEQFYNSQMHSAPALYNGSIYVGAGNFNFYCLGDARIMSAKPANYVEPTPAPSSTPEPLTAGDIAQKVLAGLPQYPSSPSAEEIARKVIASLPAYPTGVSADEVAQKVLASLPANPTVDQIAQAINNQLSSKAANVPAEYSTATVVIIAAVVVAIGLGIANLVLVRKRK